MRHRLEDRPHIAARALTGARVRCAGIGIERKAAEEGDRLGDVRGRSRVSSRVGEGRPVAVRAQEQRMRAA